MIRVIIRWAMTKTRFLLSLELLLNGRMVLQKEMEIPFDETVVDGKFEYKVDARWAEKKGDSE